jgi:hypothetical protein
MRYTLPTQHRLYFGIQVKKGKLDASGVTKTGNGNIAEIHTQALTRMVLLQQRTIQPSTSRIIRGQSTILRLRHHPLHQLP